MPPPTTLLPTPPPETTPKPKMPPQEPPFDLLPLPTDGLIDSPLPIKLEDAGKPEIRLASLPALPHKPGRSHG